MNIIIDSNIASSVLLEKHKNLFEYLRKKIDDGFCKIVYGGKLRDEYWNSNSIRKLILRYDQSGKACAYNSSKIKTLARVLRKEKTCKSNDEHIISLAIVSGARLLCTKDKDLHSDFKNKKLIDKPRGRIYQHTGHNRTLDYYCELCQSKA